MSDVDMSFEYDDDDDDQSEFSYDEYSDYEDHSATDKNFRSQNTTPDDLNMDSNKLASFKKWTSGDFIDGVFLQAAIDLKNSQLPQCDLDDLLIMLQYCKWQPDEVINNYYDNFDKFINDCGLVKQKNNQMLIKDDYMCFICCEEYKSTKTFSLSCGHEYCVNCYGHYVLNQVSAGHLIKCMDSSCNLTIPHVIVQELIDLTLTEHEIKDNSLSLKNSHFNSQNGAYPLPLSLANNALLVSAARLYIDSKSFKFKRCPAPDCDNLIELVENYRLQLDNDPNPEFEFNGDDIDIEQKDNDIADKLDDTSSTTEIHKKSKVDKTSTIRSTRSKSKANKKSQPKKLDEKLDNKRSDYKKVVDISLIPIVSCINEHQFCYNCQYENHLPCPCHLVKAWIKKCKDDSETANWIEANTHSCPKCLASIEKNGGCNHMTCSTCRFEFCWICLREWKIHGSQYYKCNNFDATEKEMIEMNKKQKGLSLQRYLHYYKRFSVHESSMKGDLKTLEKINQRMESYMSEQSKHNLANLSWTDVQFLKDAFKALTNGRKTLKWSYCCGFYLKELIFAEVFEQAQEHLNRVVEDLSKIVEEINDKKNNDRSTELIMKNKQDIITLTTAVIKGQHSLIDCAETGLKEKRLEFEPSL